MTDNEAIEVLKQPCYCDYDLSATIEDCEVSSCDRRDAMKLAINALEKQIAKKIVKHDKCPVCNNGQSTTWYYVGASYCEYCGQKLSWESDTD